MSRCTIDGADLRCLNCGGSYTMGLPATIEMSLAMFKVFQDEHAHCEPSAKGEERFQFTTPEQWMSSWDTGQSSKTIWHVMMGRGIGPGTIPYDPADFGRCHRLLKAFPQWRVRLDEMSMVRGWEPFVDAWPHLEKLYELEMPSGTAQKLYAAMSKLVNGKPLTEQDVKDALAIGRKESTAAERTRKRSPRR